MPPILSGEAALFGCTAIRRPLLVEYLVIGAAGGEAALRMLELSMKSRPN